MGELSGGVHEGESEGRIGPSEERVLDQGEMEALLLLPPLLREFLEGMRCQSYI